MVSKIISPSEKIWQKLFFAPRKLLSINLFYCLPQKKKNFVREENLVYSVYLWKKGNFGKNIPNIILWHTKWGEKRFIVVSFLGYIFGRKYQ